MRASACRCSVAWAAQQGTQQPSLGKVSRAPALPACLACGCAGAVHLTPCGWCRRVPLSEGRIEPSDGNLQCCYHGWRFDGAGKCVAIPALEHVDARAHQHACSSPQACVPSFPVRVRGAPAAASSWQARAAGLQAAAGSCLQLTLASQRLSLPVPLGCSGSAQVLGQRMHASPWPPRDEAIPAGGAQSALGVARRQPQPWSRERCRQRALARGPDQPAR